eukprot:TRINITY_DN3835_c0_g1_i2.p1 TRINITY_DN3835_c0_g1~~TRINITY_DN3835_c0_g1_i2.p1  ORF type:complete len:461 (-),score=99.21 TRINITY_DN3835_c0_g1_i2:64-1446(-)
MRVLTSVADTGTVTLCLPQDVQTEAYDFPAAFFRERVWHVARPRPDRHLVESAAALIRSARRPLVVAGGGVIYSGATSALADFARATKIPVAETMAGKGTLRWDDSQCVGAVGVTGALAANVLARDADVIIGVGTRYSDFTTASKTAFQHHDLKFININVTEFDVHKHMALPLMGDARVCLEELLSLLQGYETDAAYATEVASLRTQWNAEVERIYAIRHEPLPSQGELIGVLEHAAGETGIIVNAAGSMPGDLHKLWRAKHSKQFHMEYGYSCMGYEIAGGLGAKMAAPDRDVFVVVGDGSYLMLSSDLATAVQEDVKLIVVLWDNGGFKSIGSLSRSLGQDGFGTRFVKRQVGLPLAGDFVAGDYDSELLQIDFAANARSLGADTIECRTTAEFAAALEAAKHAQHTTVIVTRNDRYESVPGYASWWDVAVAEVSLMPAVTAARVAYVQKRTEERFYF